MTKNKKKLRRVERRYSVTKSAQTLVLAGMLLAGGVTGAMAATWDEPTVTINGAQTETTLITINPNVTGSHAQNINTTVLKIVDGGTLTLKDGARLVHYNRGTTSDIVGMDVTMNGGKLIITSGSSGSAQSSIDANTVNISGGEVTLTGHSGTIWQNAAYIGAYKGLTVFGGTINMGVNSELFGGGAIGAQLKGGTIKMLGTSTGSDFDGNAAHIMFGRDNTIDGATIEVGNGTAANYGVMSLGNKTEMKSGSITVKKNAFLLLQPDTGEDGGIKYDGTGTTRFHMTGGEFTVAAGATLRTPQVKFDQDGGTVTVDGTFFQTVGSNATNYSTSQSSYTINGGKLIVTGGADWHSDMEVGKLTIAGGEVLVKSTVRSSTSWLTGATLGAYGAGDNKTVITGSTAKLTLGDNSLFFAGVNGDSAANAGSWANGELNIEKGAQVIFDSAVDSAGILQASSKAAYDAANATDVPGNWAVTLNIRDAGTKVSVGAGKEGYILSRETYLSNGAVLDVQGKLTVAGKGNNLSTTIGDAITSTTDSDGGSTVTHKGVFNLDGGSVNVGANGLIDFVTGNVDLKAGGDGVLNSKLVLKDAAGTDKGTTYAKNLTVTRALTVNGNMNVVAAATGAANVNNGGSLVVSGTTKVAKANGIVVGDGSTKGSLSITKDSLFTQNTTSGKLDKNTGIIDGGISLSGTNGSNGTLIIEGFKGITVNEDTFGNIFKASTTTGELAQVSNSSLILGSYEGSNVILKDAIMQGASTDIGGDKDAAAPEQLNITKPTVTAHITAPSVTTPSGNLALAPSGIMDLDANAAASGVSPTTKVGTFTNPGTTTVANGASLQVTGKANLTGGTTTVNANSSFVAAETVMGTGTKLNVLNSTSDLGTLKASAGSLFVDPAYVTVDHVDGDFGAQLLNGLGGIVNVGSKDKAWIDEALIKSGANSDASVLALKSGISLAATGQIVVDKNLTKEADGSYKLGGVAVAQATQGSLHFGDNSLLIVDAAAFSGTTAALTLKGGANDKLTTTNTAGEASKLHIYGGKAGDTVKVVSGAVSGIEATTGTHGWTSGNISFSSALLTLDKIEVGTGTQYGVKTKGVNATDTFNKLSGEMGSLANAMVGQVGIQVDHPNAGIRFMSRALDDRHIGRNNTTEAAATIEGAAQLAVVGAAPAMTVAAVQSGASAVTTRTSFASPLMDSTKAVALHKDTDGALSVDSGLSAGNGMKNGFGLWIMPLYQSNSAWGMKANGFKGGYKSDLGGVALGADYTFNDMFRFGLAFNIGGGYAESNGDFNKTENSFNFWGINAYGGWSMNNFGITADVGYTGNYNKMEQELPSAMGMADIKSDVTSSAWTAGLRGEYKFATEALDIIPHVGVRYTGLTTDEYKAKSGGDTVFKVDQSFQSIWTFPIGVTLAKEIETGSGWIIRPQVDLGITPATGDVKAKSKVRIPGVDSQAEMKMQVVDYMSYDGGVGLEMKKDNISFGINYNIQASEHRTGHGVFGTFRYEF